VHLCFYLRTLGSVQSVLLKCIRNFVKLLVASLFHFSVLFCLWYEVDVKFLGLEK
jgi:hypothetical protein